MNRWISPYKENNLWCKGAIHVHSANSHCGKLSLKQIAENYGCKSLAYDFVAITDHDSLTDIRDVQATQPLVFIPGVEESMAMNHIVAVNVDRSCRLTADGVKSMIAIAREMLAGYLAEDVFENLQKEIANIYDYFMPNFDLTVYTIWKLAEAHLSSQQSEIFQQACLSSLGEPDYQAIINGITRRGGIAIMAHPHWLREDYWEKEALDRLANYTGIEILNGDYYAPVTNIATDTWDRQLSRGRKVWGFGGDDYHNPKEFSKVWNVVGVREKSRADIVDSLARGNFYVSTGVRLAEIKADGDEITVVVTDDGFSARYDKIFRFIGREGEVLHTQAGKNPSAKYKARGDEGYARVHILMETGQMAYTQPFVLAGGPAGNDIPNDNP